jgi:tetratricopeptide (TPR) repeat protein/uncharacterized membrane protein YhaH (DUF805 family)
MMHWLVWLLFGFRGRIPRKTYWLAQAILQVPAIAGVAGYLMIIGLALPQPGPAGPLSLIWTLALLFPAFAVVVKRLNDRGHPFWVAAIWLGLACAGAAFGAFIDPFAGPINWGRGEWAAFTIFVIVGLWFVIDLGMLRGQRGPNRHGPDPLDPGSGFHATQTPAPRRRSMGENIRDSFIGALLLIAALAFSGWNFGVPELSNPVRWLMVRSSPNIWEERRANEPAYNSQQAGDEAYKARDYDGAIRDYSRAIELYGPENATAAWSYRMRAYALQRAGRLREALSDHDKAIVIEPNFTGGYRYRGLLLADMGRYEDAFRDFETALRRYPNSQYTLVARGDVLEKIGRREEALADYAQAIKSAHDSYDKLIAGNKLFDKLMGEARMEESRKRLVRDRDGTLTSAHIRRGNIYSALGQYENAIREYGHVLEFNPRSALAHYNRGTAYDSEGRHDEAITDYTSAIGLNPQYVDAYVNRGRVYDKLGLGEKALTDFDRAIELNPNDGNSYANRGWVYEEQGRLDLARDDYQRGLTLSPDDEWLKHALERTR